MTHSAANNYIKRHVLIPSAGNYCIKTSAMIRSAGNDCIEAGVFITSAEAENVKGYGMPVVLAAFINDGSWLAFIAYNLHAGIARRYDSRSA